jgi:DNA-directed RNA polymerase subunit beta'
LRRTGIDLKTAIKHYEERTPTAKTALLQEMSTRPVIIDRAPVLYKFGMMAFWPKIGHRHVMEINPFITKAFGADFDGDQMNYHVPVSEEARLEAIEKLLPSRNLLTTAKFQAMFRPFKDFSGGVWRLSVAKADPKKQPKEFKSLEEVRQAVAEGSISPDEPVIITGSAR